MPASSATSRSSRSASSTVPARCAVASRKPPASTSQASSTDVRSLARGASSCATSTITSPTTTTSPETFSWRRCSAGVAEEQSSRSEAWSARTRLSSSGIVRSNERIPASTWATGIRICAAASAPASVELVSP